MAQRRETSVNASFLDKLSVSLKKWGEQMKKILLFLVVGLSLSSPACAESIDDLWSETGNGETSLSYMEATKRLEWISTSSGLKSANVERQANVLIKEEIDEQAGKVNMITLAVMAAAAVFVYWLNRKKKQEFD